MTNEVEFTDTEGDCSTIRLVGRKLQWWCAGRCHDGDLKNLEWGLLGGMQALANPRKSHMMARLVAPAEGPERQQLKADLGRLATIAGACFTTHSDEADFWAATMRMDSGIKRTIAGSASGVREVQFTDTEGDSSTLKLHNKHLQWWSGGTCYSRDLKELIWGPVGGCTAVVAPEHSMLVARLVRPAEGPERQLLKLHICHMCAVSRTPITFCTEELTSVD